MANEEQVKILKQGVSVWREWRQRNPQVIPDLSEADLKGVYLSRAYLNGAKLCGANLSDANLTEAYLIRSNLRGAKLWDANLLGANLSGADLTAADLTQANLRATFLGSGDLSGANLFGADLTRASLDNTDFSGMLAGYTTFADVDLSTVKGIDKVRHEAPSTIGVNTIYRSRGKIPAIFLRGAGVPDNFIEYMNSLVGTAFEYYSCFISYSGLDQEFANRVHADLQDNGVGCWFAPHDVQAGKKLHEQIDVAIRLHERLLLILSPQSINSEWVKTEIAKARTREIKEGKRVLFPIRLNISFEQLQEWECFDADRGKDSGREIREYYIPDFTNWKDHDKYQEEFKKLLRDLKKETAIAAGA